MDSALKLQLDVKNNAQELQKYMLDLNNWEEEMKRKEMALTNEKPTESAFPPPRNKIKRSEPEAEKKHSVKPKKISAYDYSAWDKFDVEKALAEIDKEDENDNQEEEVESKDSNKDQAESFKSDPISPEENEDFSYVDQAYYEKEMGNMFAKKGNWESALRCYSTALNLDPSNAIYFANRSLCFLKLKNFKASETDATVAIQLDKNYVKAYHRRAYARLALGQLAEAKSDYEEILKLEPKNALALAEISKIDEKLKKDQENIKAVEKQPEKCFNPKNMFKSETAKSQTTQSEDDSKEKQAQPSALKSESEKKDVVYSKPKSKTTIKSSPECVKVDNSDNIKMENEKKGIERGDGDKVIENQPKETKTTVFKPLPEWCQEIQPVNVPPHKRSTKSLQRINISITDKDEDYDAAIETKKESSNQIEKRVEEIKCKNNEDEELQNQRLSFDVPKSAIQFYNCWKVLKKNSENCYSYLKKIPINDLPQIFENSLESDFFSQIVTFLASSEVEKDPELIYNILLGLTKVKRFSSLILFMSETDRNCVKKAVSNTEKVKSVEERSELLRLYELKP